MELHLLHTHTHEHTHEHTVGPDSQVSDYEAPSVPPPGLAPAACRGARVYSSRLSEDVCSRLSPETLLADAGIAVDGVHALRSMLTLILQTIIVVLLTVLAHVAR